MTPAVAVVALVATCVVARRARSASSPSVPQARVGPSTALRSVARSPWLDGPARWHRALVDAAVDHRVPAGPAWRIWLGLAGLGTALALAGAGPGVAVVALAMWVAPPLALHAARDRRHRSALEDLPGLLDAVTASLRAGRSLQDALRHSVPMAAGLAPGVGAMVAQVERGAALATELDSWADRLGSPDAHLAAAAMVVGERLGGRPGVALEGVAATLRERVEVRNERRSLSTQARASAVVMTLTPLAFAASASAADPRTARVLLSTPLGVLCLVAGLGLDAGAAVWMARLTRDAS